MPNEPQLTAATVPVIIGAFEYQASPLTDRDNDELDNWLKHHIVNTARELMKGETDPIFRREFIEIAQERSLLASFQSYIGVQVFGTPIGLARMVWQLIKKSHPKVTHQELVSQMRDDKNIERVMEVFQALHPERYKDRSIDTNEVASPKNEEA
jgi:hypothetical protein